MTFRSPLAIGSFALGLASLVPAQQTPAPLLIDARQSPLPIQDVALNGLQAHDFDGDGLRDLLVSADWAPDLLYARLRLLKRQTDGTFTDFPGGVIGNGRSLGPVGDFDGDGDADVVIVGNGASFVFRNDLSTGGGFNYAVFAPLSRTPTVIPFTVRANSVAGDLNGDGLDDLIVGNTTPTVHLAQASTDVRFGSGTALPISPSGILPTLALLDADLDGDLDLAVADGQDISLYLNDGQANFTANGPIVPFILLDGDTAPLKARDVDNDGDTDLVFGDDSRAGILFNGGAGSAQFGLRSKQNPVPTGQRVLGVDATDLDGDGDVDLAVASENGLRLWEWSTSSGNFFAFSPLRMPAVAGTIGAVLLEDLDSDGDGDLVFGETTLDFGQVGTEAALQVRWNDGGGSFSGVLDRVIPESFGELDAGDLDLDGDVDLVDAGGGVHLNDGTGGFTTTTPSDPLLYYALAALADLDGDGVLDLIQRSGPLFTFRRGDGTGGFTANPSATLTPNLTSGHLIQDIETADLDGDGDIDIFVSIRSPASGHPDILLENVSTGPGLQFVEHPLFATIGDGGPTAIGDLDNDGDLDVVSGNTAWDNRGNLNLVQAPMFIGIPVVPVDTLIDDLDGDGRLDLVLVGNTDGYTPDLDDNIIWNDAANPILTATLPTYTPVAGTAGTASGAGTIDLNGDGLEDLVFAYRLTGSGSTGGSQTRAFLQTAPRQFVRASSDLLPRESSNSLGLLTFDADRDGDRDVVVFNRPNLGGPGTPTSRLYLNTSLQLHTRRAPKLGTDYRIDLYSGSAGTALAFGTRTAAIPTSFGILGIDPAMLLPAGSFGGGSLDSLTIRIPQNASLVGLQLVWQAIDPARLQLTNTVVDRVLGG